MTTRTISGSSYTLGYDYENRLTSVSGAATAAFTYDGDGNRVKSVVGATTTYFVGSHYESSGGVITRYYLAGGTRVAMRTGNTFYWLFSDHLGSTSKVANATGTLHSQQIYKAWGESRYTSGTLPTRYTYTGQYSYASDFGLVFYGSRFYDPLLSRWASPDSIIPQNQGTQAWDKYAYVNNSPVNYTDPTGHWVDDGCSTEGCSAKEGQEYYDYVYNVVYGNVDKKANAEKVETVGRAFLETAASVLWEPADWALTARDCLGGNCSPLALLGLLPIIPGSKIDDIVGTVKNLDGAEAPVDDVLDLATNFLGKDYIDKGNGRFLSADGLRQVRMNDRDILGLHGGGPHINFDILGPNPAKPNFFTQIFPSIHIYLFGR